MIRSCSVLAALALGLSTACSSPGPAPANILEPTPRDTVTPATPDTVVGSLRGYGFTPETGATNIVVTVNGATPATCTDSLASQPVLRLPVTAGIMARLDQNRAAGGRVYVRPVSEYTFTGRGALGAGQDIRLSVGPTTLGTATHTEGATSPIQSRSVDVTPELPIATNQLRVGDTLRIRFDARISARLGGDCGQSTVGQVRWRLWGVVMWLAE